MNRGIRGTAALLGILMAGCGDGAARGSAAGGEPQLTGTERDAGAQLQDLIRLPDDFAPEGIAIGEGTTFYVGSLAPPTVGQILRGDLRTGEYAELVPTSGTPALGMKHSSRGNLLFVAGGPSGRGIVYDAGSGAEVASFEFAASGGVINDVVVTDAAAFFTDSQLPYLYRVELRADGRPGDFSRIDLPAIFGEQGSCPDARPITGNGIAATPDGRHLILVHMSEGKLYRLETATGEVLPIEVTGGDVCSADGLLLEGNRLYAVQNFLNRIAVVELNQDLRSGRLTRHITEPFASNPATKVPTTIADAGEALYAVTAGFAEPRPDYVVRVEKN